MKCEYSMSELVKGMFVFWWLDEGAPPLHPGYFDKMLKTEEEDEYSDRARGIIGLLSRWENMAVGDRIEKVGPLAGDI